MKRYGWDSSQAALHKVIRDFAESFAEEGMGFADHIEAELHKNLKDARAEWITEEHTI